MSGTRRVFPESFKREAVDRVATSGLSAGAVAQELGLHETVLRRWMVTFATQATGAARCPNTQAPPPSPSDLASENARLRRENDRLRMERDILKKAALMLLRRPSARFGRPVKFGFVDEHRAVWPYATRAEARRDLFGYIEGFYNPRRLHSALGYISPAEMERRAA